MERRSWLKQLFSNKAASFFYFYLSSLSYREHFLAIETHLFRSLFYVTQNLSASSWLVTTRFCNLNILLMLVCIPFPILGLGSKWKKMSFSHHMEPYVPLQGSAKWLSYLNWDLAGTSTWVKCAARLLKSYLLWQGGLQPTTVSGHGEWSADSLQELCSTSK